MFYHCYLILFIFFLCWPLDLRTSKWTAREYVMNSWGYGVVLISRDLILCLVPLFFGEMGKLSQILPKIDGAFICRVLVTKTAQRMKTGDILYKEG